MMEYVCYSKKEGLGAVSSDGLLSVLVKLWIITTLRKSGLSITGIRIFLFYSEKKISIPEMDPSAVCTWNDEKKGTLILANQDGNIRIHHREEMQAFHPAKEKEVLQTVRNRMKKNKPNGGTNMKEANST